MLFLMGISCAAVGKVLHDKKNFKEVPTVIRTMTRKIVEQELTKQNDKSELSHGESIYLKYGIDGVRGEVQRGIPPVPR